MKKHRGSTGDWLSALTIMGRILIFVPPSRSSGRGCVVRRK